MSSSDNPADSYKPSKRQLIHSASNSDKYRNLDSIAPACNSCSAVAPDLLPNVPNDGRGNELSVGVLTASCDQLSSTLDLVLAAGVTCVLCEGMGSLGSTCGDVLTHRLSASM